MLQSALRFSEVTHILTFMPHSHPERPVIICIIFIYYTDVYARILHKFSSIHSFGETEAQSPAEIKQLDSSRAGIQM